MVDVNFLSNGQSYFRAKHRDNFDSFLATLENGQMRISGTGIMVNLEQKKRQEVSMVFAQTLLPVNIFRAPNIRTFLSKLIEYKSIPGYKTVEKDICDMVQETLQKLKKVDYYGLQLDHWTNIKCKTVFLVSISHLVNTGFKPLLVLL